MLAACLPRFLRGVMAGSGAVMAGTGAGGVMAGSGGVMAGSGAGGVMAGSGAGGLPSVIELGAGTGMPGLVAHTLGAVHTLLTDLALNLPRLRAACEANAVDCGDTGWADDGGVRVAELDWQAPLPPAISTRRWDLILAADCVFWVALFHPLLHTLAALCRAGRVRGSLSGSGGCEPEPLHGDPDLRPPPCVLLSLTDRLGRAEDFVALAVGLGWRVERVESDGAAVHPTSVVRLYPPWATCDSPVLGVDA
jgi:hypothetical protein